MGSDGAAGLDGAPFGSYPPPVPYSGAADGAAPADPGGRAALLDPQAIPPPRAAPWRAGRSSLRFGGRGRVQDALRSLAPYGAARTGGERAFDLAAGTAGGVAGAATAEEDATWQERAGRFASGAVAGSLVGPTARGGLGQLARPRR